MSEIYLVFVVFLFVLAVFDLMVGVSNDAVNFLNSAIGAKVAKFRTIIIVAAVGVFLGATMSNGMMEVARNGVFHPAMFSFKELMFIFLAVMISDVILLDIFNNLGLPTSTTVSLVFELLGGTTAFVLLKLANDTTGLTVGDLMNTEKALGMIMAIFVSVAIAFFFGIVLQYISRLVFTFTYKKNLKWKIGLFGGVATTAIFYFMLFKGIKSMSFVTPEIYEYIQNHTLAILGICFLASTAIMQFLYFLKVNVFKILVLMGTFALAMAFAGNDLVNFIGVPLAGYSAYTDFAANGASNPSTFMMSSLEGPAKSPMIFLVAAGAVMVFSLATSKKAHNVIKTSVDLSRQSEGDEMFGSSKIARVLVRFSNNTANFFQDVVPDNVKAWCEKRFNTDEARLPEGAAFDEVRATVNLVVAGLLIALGTSLKLPLSTTYVTFMVAMGSSLADRAWGRESAVYRVTGVVSVIGGWFITAGAAFILCFLVAMLMHVGGFVAACIMMALAIFLLIRSNIRYKKKAEEEKAAQPPKEVGFLAVSVGDGLSELFKSLGVDYIIEGGQTMNPSTADILDAVDKVNAKTIFVLPNNKNIILAANQAAELMTDKELLVIPTKTIPQGITAVINFVPELSVEENEETMLREIKNVKTGQVTYAVRDTVIDDKEIKKDDFMGIGDQGIVAVGTDMVKVTRDMIAELVDEDSELISVYYGCDVAEDAAEALRADLEEAYPACDIELQYGGQPIYYYTVSVE